MEIRVIENEKKRFLPLLLLADEQEDMIDRYLERGVLYALFAPELKTVCVVTDEGGGVAEIKNLATTPSAQRQGYGRAMIEHIAVLYQERFHTLRVGTGDSPLTLPFYEACGFHRAFLIPHFFTDHYDHPIIEAGVQLVDMVVLERDLSAEIL
ncbi:MAG: GNAT family N-acetyltransferase [Peptococcaceae bacterium]|nr:GNAT family N-acetyltransferase [Peptococcaceae bacterium]